MNYTYLNRKKAIIVVCFLILLFVQCTKQQDRYETPPWLGGASIETLEKGGKYTTFLALMRKSSYEEPIKKQLFTLFVPDDDAFKAYFQKNGIKSVDDLSKDQARNLFTLHVLRNPRSSFQLTYEYVWSELQGPTGEYAALFFRKPTLSLSLPYFETVKYYPAQKDKTLQIYSDAKLMPLFSKDYFEDFFGDPNGSDYTFLFPGSTWTGMHWHNAGVIDAEVRTASGFIYYVDQVVQDMNSIEEYMIAHQDSFSVFYDLAQRFANYVTPKTNERKEVMYKKSYTQIFNFADQNGPYTGAELKLKDCFTAYIPLDNVLKKYLDDNILKYYPSIDSVPKVTLFYILQSHLSQSLGLVSKISKNYFNSFGDAIKITPSVDIAKAHMCSNGALYAMNRVLEPNAFTCVPGPIFFKSNYTTFLYALIGANMIGSLSNPDIEVTLFAPDNDRVEEYGIRYNDYLNYMEALGKDNIWKKMRPEDLLIFVQDHIYNGKLSDLSGEGFVQMLSGNNIYYKNNNIETGGNREAGDLAKIYETQINDRNGILYYVDNVLKTPKFSIAMYISQDPDLSSFAELLNRTKLMGPVVDQLTRDTVPAIKFIGEATLWTAFAPDNNAISKAQSKGLIPEDEELLKQFLMYHFIRKTTIFDDGKISGIFPTARIDTVIAAVIQYSELQVDNSLNNLKVTDNSGQVISVDHAKANIIAQKGSVHKISSVLKIK